MPVKTRTIPKAAIERLRTYVKAQEQASRELYSYEPSHYMTDEDVGRLPNIDRRKDDPTRQALSQENLKDWGRRVRLLKATTRAGKDVDVVIKKIHKVVWARTAKAIIGYLKRVIVKHNAEYKDPHYVLVAPEMYAIGTEYIAMKKYDYPDVREVLLKETPRGKKVYDELLRLRVLNQMESAAERVNNRAGFYQSNVMYLGIRRGKHVFMPLADLS